MPEDLSVDAVEKRVWADTHAAVLAYGLGQGWPPGVALAEANEAARSAASNYRAEFYPDDPGDDDDDPDFGADGDEASD